MYKWPVGWGHLWYIASISLRSPCLTMTTEHKQSAVVCIQQTTELRRNLCLVGTTGDYTIKPLPPWCINILQYFAMKKSHHNKMIYNKSRIYFILIWLMVVFRCGCLDSQWQPRLNQQCHVFNIHRGWRNASLTSLCLIKISIYSKALVNDPRQTSGPDSI